MVWESKEKMRRMDKCSLGVILGTRGIKPPSFLDQVCLLFLTMLNDAFSIRSLMKIGQRQSGRQTEAEGKRQT